MPKPAAIAMLVDVNPNLPQAESERRDVQAAARAIGQELIVLEAGSDGRRMRSVAICAFPTRSVRS